jgi:hypothetical protein
MDKKEVAKLLRKKLNEAIKSLPDVEYERVSLFTDDVCKGERDFTGNNLHNIELSVEEVG